MDSILSLLRSIDFWTIVGAVAAIGCVVVGTVALPGFQKKSKSARRETELADMVKIAELNADGLVATYKLAMRITAADTKGVVVEKERIVSENRAVAKAIYNLSSQPEFEQPAFRKLKDAVLDLGQSINGLVSGETSFQQVQTAIKELRGVRLRMAS